MALVFNLAGERIAQTEGAKKENNYSKDQLSMGGSIGDIYIDQYWLNQNSCNKEVYILEGGLTPYLTLNSNEYQSYI